MPYTPCAITVEPDGATVAVTIRRNDSSGRIVEAYTTENGSSSFSFPKTITSTTKFWLAGPGQYYVGLTVGGEDAGSDTVFVTRGSVAFVKAYVPAGEPGLSVSVLDYGAVADGSTNAATAFQSALDAVSAAGGGEVFAPAGTYVVGSSLNLTDHVTLRGAGPNTVIKGVFSSVTSAVVKNDWVNGNERIAIRDLRVDRTGTNAQHGIRIQNAEGVTVENVEVVGANTSTVTGGAISIGGFESHSVDPLCTGVRVANCRIVSADNFGIQLGAVNGATVTGNVLEDCYREAIGVEPGELNETANVAKNVAITGNSIRSGDTKSSGSTATGVIVITESSGGTVSGVACTGNVVTVEDVIAADTTPGIVVLGGSGVVVADNTVVGANGAGIRLGNSSFATASCSVTGNVLVDCNQGGADSSSGASVGIGLQGSGTSGNLVSGNLVSGDDLTAGIKESSGAAGNYFVDNLIDHDVPYVLDSTSTVRDITQAAALTAQSEVTGSTTTTVLGTGYTIKGGTVRAGDTYRIYGAGTIDQSAAGGTMTFRCRVGGVSGTSIAVINYTIPASASAGKYFWIEAVVTFRSASSAVCSMRSQANLSSGLSHQTYAPVATAVTTTSDVDLCITVVNPTNDEAVRVEVFYVEKIR